MVIIDASTAFKWFEPSEQDHNKALQLWDLHLQNKMKIVVPDLILYELANAWMTKSSIQLGQVKINLRVLEEASLEIIPVNFILINKATQFSKKYSVSVYDAIYAVLAKAKKCLLITADERFVEKMNKFFPLEINLPFIKLLKEYK